MNFSKIHMRIISSLFIFLISLTISGQIFQGGNANFGLTIGATNYIPNANYLFSKSSTGYTIGVISKINISDRLDLLLELNYNNHCVEFIGRENELSTTEDIEFSLQNFSIPLLIDFSYFLEENYKLGVNTGVSFNLGHEYRLTDESKENYVLDPIYTAPRNLQFDTFNDELPFNMFLIFGLSGTYHKRFMMNLRYHYGITDPYEDSPVFSPYIDLKGRDSYITLTFSYLF